jgi:hypothetical protein
MAEYEKDIERGLLIGIDSERRIARIRRAIGRGTNGVSNGHGVAMGEPPKK